MRLKRSKEEQGMDLPDRGKGGWDSDEIETLKFSITIWSISGGKGGWDSYEIET